MDIKIHLKLHMISIEYFASSNLKIIIGSQSLFNSNHCRPKNRNHCEPWAGAGFSGFENFEGLMVNQVIFNGQKNELPRTKMSEAVHGLCRQTTCIF
jgi:hypothetical protein